MTADIDVSQRMIKSERQGRTGTTAAIPASRAGARSADSDSRESTSTAAGASSAARAAADANATERRRPPTSSRRRGDFPLWMPSQDLEEVIYSPNEDVGEKEHADLPRHRTTKEMPAKTEALDQAWLTAY